MISRRLKATCFIPMLLVAAVTSAQSREVIPVDGEPYEAELKAVDDAWQLTFGQGTRRRQLAAVDLVRWGSWADARRGPVLVLADGGLLVADVIEADRDKITADADLFGLVELPADRVAAIVFLPPADRHARDLLWDRVRSGSDRTDQVLLANGDEIAGRVRRLQDERIELEADVGSLEIEVARVRSLIFDPALVGHEPVDDFQAIAGLADGSRLIIDRLVLDGRTAELIALGQTFTALAEDLVCLMPIGGRAVYLSDLRPSGHRQLAYLEVSWPPYHDDRNILGGLLRCDGQLYLKGLGVHSASRVTYRLDEPFERFEARLGIDDCAQDGGSVRFRVYVDGRPEFASGIVRGGDAPLPVLVPLDGAKRLDLIVDYADRADELDRADWLEARLVR